MKVSSFLQTSILLIAGVCLNAGCSSANTEISPTLEPKVTSSQSITSTPSFTPKATLGPTQTNTQAPKPTATYFSTQTQTPSSTPTTAPGEVPTPFEITIATRQTDGMQMVFVPLGEFMMGNDAGAADERPLHKVILDAFWINQTEVTNAMFLRFVEATGYQTNAEKRGSAWAFDGTGWSEISGADWQHPQGPESNINDLEDHPVVNVSWNDAKAYCEWAGARLATEAEWEKAARAVDGRTYPWGEQAPSGTLLNFGDFSLFPSSVDVTLNDEYRFTAPVGSFRSGASPYGALDMAGNVWEWVNDWYQAVYYSQSPTNNPVGPTSGEGRVFRGGSWNHSSLDIRSSIRMWDKAYGAIDNVGFRCATTSP